MTIIPEKNQDGTPIFNEQELTAYWNISLPTELPETQTIRAVFQTKDFKTEELKAFTSTVQLRTPANLMQELNNQYARSGGKECGVSISTAVFDYNGKPPTSASFNYTQAIAIDIDTHIGNTKARYPLGYLDDDQIRFAIMNTWLKVCSRFHEFGIDLVRPQAALLTGNGLQLIIGFNKSINKNKASEIFNLFKMAIGDLVWRTKLQDSLGMWNDIEHDIDKSFSDITHVQRCAGTLNQKTKIPARLIELFDYDPQQLAKFKAGMNVGVEMSDISDQEKSHIKEEIEISFALFDKAMQKTEQSLVLDVDTIQITAAMQAGRTLARPSQLQNIEYELLTNLKKMDEHPISLMRGEIKVGTSTGNLTKLYCPFHEERNPSMAYYNNDLIDTIKDFHDNKSYNFIEFWEAIYKVSKSEAITQISEKAGIKLGKTERKDFENLELAELVRKLISDIDQEKFVYYRLASKKYTCIVRNIHNGEPFIFDGPGMLATHILANQLNVHDADAKLIKEFSIQFEKHVLIDAFEEFKPGEKTVFAKDFIKFVNLWVPNEKYQKVHHRVEEIKETVKEEYSIDETIALVKRKCPWTYKILLQIIQNGDMEWFINWMSGVSKFKVFSTMPVIFGIQGAGKNVFVNTVMDYYLNNEYVKTVSGDRIMQQFNSILETANLVVLDEGDFSNNKEVDQLKLLTGNSKILIEKKGIDASNKERHFNFMFFSNGDVPIRHPAMDRRHTYFYTDVSLLASTKYWGIEIDDMIIKITAELNEFWAIIFMTKYNTRMGMANCKNGQFWKQILRQHTFGNLVVQMLNNEWRDIGLQLNENVSDTITIEKNINLLKEIQKQFESNGAISISLINLYMQSLNYRTKQSITNFLKVNHMEDMGITIEIIDKDVIVKVDRKKLRNKLKIKNVLKVAYPKIAHVDVSELEADLAADEADLAVEVNHVEEAEEHTPFELVEDDAITPPPPPPPGNIQSSTY